MEVVAMPAVKCKCRGCGDVGTLEINPDDRGILRGY